MAVSRQLNLLSQQRLDIPDLRALESAIAGDFDALVGKAMAGGRPVVVRGLALGNVGTILATSLELVVADSIVFNLNATESGTFLWVPETRAVEVLNPITNAKVVGAFVAGVVNNVGLDFVRSPDDTTTDLVQFKNLTTGLEDPRQVPKASTLDYRIVITTAPFSTLPNLIPIARITTSSSNVATLIEDVRPMMYRLGAGGDEASNTNSYPWPQARTEGTTGNALFTGGDKSIRSQKDWVDAIMTRVWEIGGGERWFSAGADRNVQLITTGAVFSNGEYFEWDGTNLHWKGLQFVFDNSTGNTNEVADQTVTSSGLTNLLDGECIYVDLDRSANRTGGSALSAQKATLTSLGAGTPPGSRWIIAWRKGYDIVTRGWRYPVGTTFTPATASSLGVVKLNAVPESAFLPVVVTIKAGGGVTVGATSGNTVGGLFEGFGNGEGLRGIGNGSGAGVYGASTGNGVEGHGDLYGLLGQGDSGGGRFIANPGTNATGSRSEGDGTGHGGYAIGGSVASGQAGSGYYGQGGAGSGTGLGGYGVYGKGGAGYLNGGTGIYGEGGTGPNDGGVGVYGKGGVVGSHYAGDGVVGEAGGPTGVGLRAVGDLAVSGSSNLTGNVSMQAGAYSGGDISMDAAQVYKFDTVKTGVIIIAAPEYAKASGAATLAPGDGTFASIYYALGTGDARLMKQVNLPRGATITDIKAYMRAGSANYTNNQPKVVLHTYNGDGSAVVPLTILSGASTFTVTIGGTPQWWSLGAVTPLAMPSGSSTAAGGSAWIDIDFNLITAADVQFGAIKITYTYTEVDFMV